MVQRIIRNAIKCLKCGDIIESKAVHDFVTCSCGSCSVDGGHEYLRRCGEPCDWEEMNLIVDDNDISTTPFEWNSQTEYGEPQAWYNLKDGSTIEICHEEHGLTSDEQFYSLRRHCSEKDFENDIYSDTCGVIQSVNGDSRYIKTTLESMIREYGLAENTDMK